MSTSSYVRGLSESEDTELLLLYSGFSRSGEQNVIALVAFY